MATSESWESKCEAIERAFLALPIAQPVPGATGLPHRWLIPHIPRQLRMLNRGPRPRLSPKEEKRLRDLPPILSPDDSEMLRQDDLEMLSRRPRPLPDTKGLRALEEPIGLILESLDDLSEQALNAIKDYLPDPALNELNILLRRLREAAKAV